MKFPRRAQAHVSTTFPKQLSEAFVRGSRVPYEAWNNISTFYTPKPAQRLSKDRYDSIRAEVLEAVLLSLPKQEDNKQRMLVAQKITKDVMTILGREVSNG